MTYSLFSQETNFTEMLFGKLEKEVIQEREGNSSPSFSGGSSSPAFSTESGDKSEVLQKHLVIMEHLASLLEIVEPGVIRLATDVAEYSGQSPELCTRMPPPGFAPLPPPTLFAKFDEMLAENTSNPPPSPFWPSQDAFRLPLQTQFPVSSSELNPAPTPLFPTPVFPYEFAMLFPYMMSVPSSSLHVPYEYPVPFEISPSGLQAPFEDSSPCDLESVPSTSFWPVAEQNQF